VSAELIGDKFGTIKITPGISDGYDAASEFELFVGCGDNCLCRGAHCSTRFIFAIHSTTTSTPKDIDCLKEG
jgi:hypothetical protein